MTDSPAFLPSAHSPHRSSSKGGDYVSPASQRKDMSGRVSQRAPIHAYDCFVWRTDFSVYRGREGGTSAYK